MKHRTRGTGRMLAAFLLPLALLLCSSAAFAQAASGSVLYVSRFVFAEPGNVSLGDIVRAPADLSAQAREALSRNVAVLETNVLIVPASLYRDLLEASFGPDWIVVGSRTIVAPRSALPEGEAYLLDKLADFLLAQGLAGTGPTELVMEQNLVKGAMPQEGSPVFQALKGPRGSIEVSFALSAGTGSVTGRVALPGVDGAASPQADGVRAGAIVQVVFRKGWITIEMPGKAMGSARVGERVSVLVAESQKSFVAHVVDGKAVEVDLP